MELRGPAGEWDLPSQCRQRGQQVPNCRGGRGPGMKVEIIIVQAYLKDVAGSVPGHHNK